MSLADLMKEDMNRPPPQDKLDAIRAALTRLREVRLQRANLEERLEEAKKQEAGLLQKELPELMDQAKVPSIELAAENNLPAVIVEVKPYYSANIAASWPEGQRRAAFDWLQANGHGDLIKTTVLVQFKREERDRALQLQRRLAEEAGVTPGIREEVHFQTLTSWLKDQVEQKGVVPPLDLLGATIGRVAKIKERD